MKSPVAMVHELASAALVRILSSAGGWVGSPVLLSCQHKLSCCRCVHTSLLSTKLTPFVV